VFAYLRHSFLLGTQLKSSDLPPEKLNIFKKVFSELKQRVLWKFETDDKFSKNVMIRNWMPQSDILAHPHVKVFITHGGLFGTQEGVYQAVPMLGIPIYCDQHLNMKKANAAGYAINLSFKNITETSLKWALNELLQNPVYQEKVQQISKQFRDRPMNPMDESVYWIEFVARHKGAPHIRSSALDMSWFSYMLLDVILFFVLCIVSVFLVFYIIMKLIRRNCRAQKLSQRNKKNK
jgi:glucuronosyltransferase